MMKIEKLSFSPPLETGSLDFLSHVHAKKTVLANSIDRSIFSLLQWYYYMWRILEGRFGEDSEEIREAYKK